MRHWKHIQVLFIATLFQGCRTSPSYMEVDLPELCEVLPVKFESRNYTMVSSAQMSPGYEVIADGVLYTVAVNDANRVIYVSTSDLNFETEEGLSVESTLEEASALTEDELYLEPGFGYILPLPSGWCAAFFMGGGATDYPPNSDTMVDWFFKRSNCRQNTEPNHGQQVAAGNVR